MKNSCNISFNCAGKDCKYNHNKGIARDCDYMSAGFMGINCNNDKACVNAMLSSIQDHTTNIDILRDVVKERLRHLNITNNSIARDLNVSDVLVSNSVNFNFNKNNRLKGSPKVWLWIENNLDINIFDKLKKWGLR